MSKDTKPGNRGLQQQGGMENQIDKSQQQRQGDMGSHDTGHARGGTRSGGKPAAGAIGHSAVRS